MIWNAAGPTGSPEGARISSPVSIPVRASLAPFTLWVGADFGYSVPVSSKVFLVEEIYDQI
jgi:hypothetical protein